jgi:predicted TIM-barrel fold metal-dependent hydrolase
LIIDAHTHLLDEGHWPSEWWDWVADDWAGKAPGRQPSAIRDRIEAGLIDPSGHRMVGHMDDCGVDKSVLLPIDWGPDYTGTRAPAAVVDKMLRLAHLYRGRFIPFGGIDPRRDGALELVTEWLERGIRGLKLYPGCGWDPTSDAAMEIYSLCAERTIPMLFHTGDPLPLLDREKSNPILLKEVVQTFSDLPVWLGHAGAPAWWPEALQVAECGPNVRLEMSVWAWGDTDAEGELEFTRHVLEAGTVVGLDRVIFGTDHVSGAKVREPGFLDTVKGIYQRLPANAAALGQVITSAEMDLIMGGTAAHDLGVRL